MKIIEDYFNDLIFTMTNEKTVRCSNMTFQEQENENIKIFIITIVIFIIIMIFIIVTACIYHLISHFTGL